MALMLVHAAFASLAQINGSMLFASGETKAHVVFGIIFMGVSIPCSYFMLASADAHLPGLGLGSLGLAIKMVILLVLHVNAVSWWISRNYGWKFDWAYQVVALGGVLIFGGLSFEFVELFNSFISISLFFQAGLMLLLYCGFVGMMMWWMPWVAGVSRQEVKNFMFKVFKLSWA